MVWAATRLALGRNGAVRSSAARLLSDDLHHKALPRFLATGDAIASHEGHTAARLQPLQGVRGHTLLIEAVERFPDGDQGT
jgi:hypothetical protein